jgi:hypothetical protein
MNTNSQIRINKLTIKDYIDMRLSLKKYSTNVAYHGIRCLNIEIGKNFQQAIYQFDNNFDFNFEPSDAVLIKFKNKYLNKK